MKPHTTRFAVTTMLLVSVALLQVPFFLFMGACDATAAPPKAPAKLGARKLGGMAPSLAPNDAGVNVDESGVASFALGTPQPMPFDGGSVDHCQVTSISIDPASCTLYATVGCGLVRQNVSAPLSAAQCTGIHALIKQAASDSGLR